MPHGDLNHENLLWSADWVAIDPHGVVGEGGYDIGPRLINPWATSTAALAPRHLDVLHDVLGVPNERLAAWGLVRAVLAEAWMVQDTGRPHGVALRIAEAMTPLRGAFATQKRPVPTTHTDRCPAARLGRGPHRARAHA